MMQPTPNPEQTGYAVVDPQEALRLYEEGVHRLRRPEPRLLGNGLDTNSYHFRGVRAAMDVVRTFPHETDADGRRLPDDPDAINAHMEQGLAEITRAGRGMRPLAGEFVAGYERMSEAFTRPPEDPASPVEQVPPVK